MPGGRLIADTLAVTAVGAAGVPTVLVQQQDYDQRASIISPSPGVFVSHKPFTLTQQGYALPSAAEVHFDIPAGEGLWAITAAGTIQVSRLVCPNLQHDGTVAHIILAYLKSLGVKEVEKPQSGGVIKRPSEFEKFDPFGAQKKQK